MRISDPLSDPCILQVDCKSRKLFVWGLVETLISCKCQYMPPAQDHESQPPSSAAKVVLILTFDRLLTISDEYTQTCL